MLLRLATVAMMMLALVPAFAQTPEDAAANRLFVEAVQLWNRAEGETGAARLATLQRVQSNLKGIVERYAGSSLAVRLVIGGRVGPLSVGGVEDAVEEERFNAVRAQPPRDVPRSFRDCPECPEMVVIPAAQSYLASGRNVTIGARFAVGKFETTFAEWDSCVAAGGCSHRPDDRGWGRGLQPVMGVSWDDAQQYVAWLSRTTGKTYRLLSEAEWEYAAQAGSGREQVAQAGANQANCRGCGGHWDGKQTAPVGSFAANAFGLHDMLGNVIEWTADCWNPGYAGAPTDGSARMSGDCTYRVLRGGSWNLNPRYNSSAHRSFDSKLSHVSRGFRVARTL